MTVANELGFTTENAPRFTAFAMSDDSLYYQLDNEHRIMIAYYLDNGKIVGYYSLLLQENNQCELNNLCVLPDYRHKSIGADLLNDSFSRAKSKKCTTIKIGIVEENKVLRKWYKKTVSFIQAHIISISYLSLVATWRGSCNLINNTAQLNDRRKDNPAVVFLMCFHFYWHL